MPLQIDHIILNVNDRAKSIEFYTQTLGLKYEGERAGLLPENSAEMR
jgi:catechol 2,3-dioxygenase-like lactoylglutathione lyase family enzyme